MTQRKKHMYTRGLALKRASEISWDVEKILNLEEDQVPVDITDLMNLVYLTEHEGKFSIALLEEVDMLAEILLGEN